jgi:hypothetical protein
MQTIEDELCKQCRDIDTFCVRFVFQYGSTMLRTRYDRDISAIAARIIIGEFNCNIFTVDAFAVIRYISGHLKLPFLV